MFKSLVIFCLLLLSVRVAHADEFENSFVVVAYSGETNTSIGAFVGPSEELLVPAGGYIRLFGKGVLFNVTGTGSISAKTLSNLLNESLTSNPNDESTTANGFKFNDVFKRFLSGILTSSALRSTNRPILPDPWFLPIDRSATLCLHKKVKKLWRSDSRAFNFVEIIDEGSGEAHYLEFLAGSHTASLPAALTFKDGGYYTITRDGAAENSRWYVKFGGLDTASGDGILQIFYEQKCVEQFLSVVQSMKPEIEIHIGK